MVANVSASNIAGAQPQILSEQLHCALTGVPIRAEDAYWAPPLVTFRTLISTLAHTLMYDRDNLAHVLFDEQPNVPYAQEAREQLAARRSSEQLKLLGGLLLVLALIATPIILVALN